jgi:hypothetical protein
MLSIPVCCAGLSYGIVAALKDTKSSVRACGSQSHPVLDTSEQHSSALAPCLLQEPCIARCAEPTNLLTFPLPQGGALADKGSSDTLRAASAGYMGLNVTVTRPDLAGYYSTPSGRRLLASNTSIPETMTIPLADALTACTWLTVRGCDGQPPQSSRP